MKFRYFVRKAFKLTFFLIVLLSVLSLEYFQFFQPYRFFTWLSLFFFLGLTLFSGYYNTRSIKKRFFFNIFFGTLAVKFVLSLAFLVAFLVYIDPDNKKMYVIPFFLMFLIFKVFETYMLLRFAQAGDSRAVDDAGSSAGS
ncbi:MAG: hypothetical protein KatS3mg031_1196 [Chitinophagales bacterium]|nr:MAG: hypothetical protein KatS3mg031_1196 [Chitinophagales bacterium]